MDRRAKIGATLGPATDDRTVLQRMVATGLDVARLNFSHGTIDEHRARVASTIGAIFSGQQLFDAHFHSASPSENDESE